MSERLHPGETPFGGDGAYASSVFAASAQAVWTEADRQLQLEKEIARQRDLLDEAARFLNEAAYLARYHQPSLERHIRDFLGRLPK